MIEKNKTFFSLLLFMIIVISILPGTSALAMDGKGKQITEFPVTKDLKRCKPVYKTFKGWKN